MVWETWAQIAGVGGLVLGLYNVFRGAREPVRLHQRELRGQLRALLYDIRRELEDARHHFDRNQLGPIPNERFREFDESFARLQGSLISPGNAATTDFHHKLMEAVLAWDGYRRGPDEPPPDQILVSRRRGRFRFKTETRRINQSPTASEFRELLYAAISSVTRLINITVRIDNGSYRTYRKYKDKLITRHGLHMLATPLEP